MIQLLTKAETQRYRIMNALKINSHGFRRARTRSLIVLGGLIEKSGLLETFQLTLGDDFQKDPETRDPIAALFKGLLVLNEMAQSEDVYLSLWVSQGLEALAKKS
ncbi:MAG: hypothetical protein A2W46_03075 [Alphaproteobacteria bacterium RIFCSPHIGHO2_12_42_13]|nr:MAG: hypothetical protein A2Z80_02460 [Alphaproteobacteria bacterium GWA2_41_27]OFW93300.1 MAG: hypothetical protein A2W46_03075 [Alphaproteobacteria bacterium RIFCSPHIGHO2_12_42_13]OFX07593.1 MAG: hypothetical protein A3G78_04680 [Alphaproteobacteria bacterium RIFCSPLOWO2_12_FULL_42_29]